MSSGLHQVLLGCGYRYTKAQHIPSSSPLLTHNKAEGFYVKGYQTVGGEFNVALRFTADPHITLPAAYVLKSPDQYSGLLLPHINMGWYLCYVEEMEADWDANDLVGTYRQVDAQIQLTLDSAVSSIVEGTPDDQEMEGEFSSYWLPDKEVYVLSDTTEKVGLMCVVATHQNAVEKPETISGEEWIVYEKGDEKEFLQWLKQRSLTPSDGKSFLASYFKIKPSRLAGVLWPPKDLRAVFQWLTEVDLSARGRILEHFINNPVKRHVLLLDVHHQDMVGLYVELDIAATGLNTYPQKNNRKRTGRIPKHSSLVACISAKRSVKRFIRLGVTRADRKTIVSRNRRRSSVGDLSSKRIALIGCGTVGGYLSSLLLRAGAGCGQARFDLYDHDSFGPHNFGRHALSTVHFGQNKAIAVAATLKTSTHLACNAEGKPNRFLINAEALKQYDIVIDATGRPPVSRRLAHVVRTLPYDKRPLLVHGFNDGNGRSSKVVVDNGSCCFGCLLADPAFYKEGLDIRFKNIANSNERHVSCGSTYTPYDAAVSVITASMIQEAVLSSLESKLSWTYKEHMLDGSRSRQPRYLPRQPSCDICHGHN